MRNQKYIYIAREYFAAEYGLIRIDQESAYDSFEKAQDFLKELRDDYDGEFLNDHVFRHVIIKMPL